MKISSASKKVLASALSAAMVVAFAPTVAFGVTKDSVVTVKYDVTGLVAGNGVTAPADESVQLSGYTATLANVPAAGAYAFADTTPVAGWYFDVNGNGVKDSEDKAVAAGGTSLAIDADTDVENATIVLKPYAAATLTITNTLVGDPVQPGATGNITSVAATGSSVYKATLSKDGAELASMTLSGSTAGAFKVVDAYTTTDKKDTGAVLASEYGAGKYVVTVTDIANAKNTASEAFEICKVTFKGIFYTGSVASVDKDVLFYKGETVAQAATANTIVGTPASYKDTTKAALATGYAINGVKVTTSTALKNGDVAEGIYADTAYLKASYKNKAIVLNGGYGASTLNGMKAVVTVNGTEKTTALTGAADEAVYSFGDAAVASGKYTVSVYKTEVIGGSSVETKVGESTVELATITYDAGDGKLPTGTPKTAIAEVGGAFDTAPAPTLTGMTFAGWSIDGTSVLKSTAKVAGDTTLKAVWTATTSEKAAWAWDNNVLTVTAPAGYKAFVQITDNGVAGANTEYKAPIALKASDTTAVSAAISLQKTTGSLAPAAAVTIVSSNGKAIKNAVETALVAETSDSTKTAPKYYSVELKDAVTAAKKAVKDHGYDTTEGWAKVTLAQEAAIIQAVADYENAQIDAYLAGVTDKDGNLKKIGTAAADKAKAAIATVVADYTAMYDADTKTVASDKYANEAAFVTAINKAAKDAVNSAATIAKADVDAAAAVTAQLKDPATAAAGLEAFKALSDAAKELVSVADLAAAEEAVAAAELKDAQDDAAISKARNASKTVKAGKSGKTTKKQSVTLKAITSKSGAKVTYKKSSGSSKVTVKSGKAYLAKGVKKGTYKATVKATCGTQTAKIKVTFKVK